MFLPKEHTGEIATEIELIRSTEEEKGQQIENVRNWQEGRNAVALPPLPLGEGRGEGALRADASETENLAYLQNAARERGNVFEALMEAVKTHSLGQVGCALYDVDGECRRNM
ncbi:hypothetical protein J2W68_001643 [Luteimonas terrae]|uniref:Uncharacterized protein n=1 Tax=Luteimonas terrae TaxID=1530191 RepID=A0ABU1XVZ6_9GAMM|nr:hypothetical protein [Luteimonas terrae]